jgi:hypothetical protein
LIALGIIYYGWYIGDGISVMIFVPIAFLVGLYVFYGPIDHWWLTKFPVPIDPKLKTWLTENFSPYRKMGLEMKNKFEYRLSLYLDARLFQSVGSEMRDVPEDIKCMIAAHGIYMTLGTDDYLLGDMDRIFLYKHPFPSPDFPFLHTVETNAEDGVIILSMEQVVFAVLNPEKYYNVAYHAYAEAFIFVHHEITFPDFNNTWQAMEKISGWEQDFFYKQTGFEKLSLPAVNIALFFSHAEKYEAVLPELYFALAKIFNLSNLKQEIIT